MNTAIPIATNAMIPPMAPVALRSRAIATIGRNSPTAPAAKTNGPSAVFSVPFSRRIGSRVPSAVVVSAIVTSTLPSITRSCCTISTKASASPAVTNQERIASLPGS